MDERSLVGYQNLILCSTVNILIKQLEYLCNVNKTVAAMTPEVIRHFLNVTSYTLRQKRFPPRPEVIKLCGALVRL
jgi:hypothetical protein